MKIEPTFRYLRQNRLNFCFLCDFQLLPLTMKKQLFFLICFLIGHTAVQMQNPIRLTQRGNSFLAGDSLYKYQVTYKDPGSTGRELDWDFSNARIIKEDYLLKYFQPDSADNTKLCGLEHRTRYYYRQRNDSLWATGFENYTTMMEYTTPELKLKFPFTYGDTLHSPFEGKGMYSNMLTLQVKGYTRIEADAEGKLKLPDGKKYNKALRLYTKRYYSETGRDSLQMTLDTYSWYVKGIRYPVFESIKTSLHYPGKDTTLFYTSFYYTPEELQGGGSYNNSTDMLAEAEKIFTEATLYPNPVISDLKIEYKLARDATIWFSIHNNIGQPVSITVQRKQSEGWNSEIISMGHLIRGTYTLYVHVDDKVLNRVVIKK